MLRRDSRRSATRTPSPWIPNSIPWYFVAAGLVLLVIQSFLSGQQHQQLLDYGYKSITNSTSHDVRPASESIRGFRGCVRVAREAKG